MNPNKIPAKVSKLPGAAQPSAARDQADAYESLFRNRPLELNDGTELMIPPHPDFGMLDDDRMADYEELKFETETFDREDDIYIPEQTLENGVVLPAETRRGDLLRPYRRDGELIKPPHTVRVVMAVLGPDDYARLKAGGRSAADVWKIWGQQGMEVRERQFQGSGANGSTVGLETVP
jgi:hypothetical protein